MPAHTLHAGIKKLRSQRSIPVLFIHGHLGTHQQMRSMASESSREALRRLNTSTYPFIFDWHAVDLNSEPSAFEPTLIDQQARFVAHCINHLLYLSPLNKRILLIGYSMGGLVLNKALEISNLDSSPESIMMIMTLGTPRYHQPTFLPQPPYIQHQQRHTQEDFLSSIPQLHIVAGPGDFMIPSLSAWIQNKKGRQKKSLYSSVDVDMKDIPGVWCTTNHKSLVSCNQLVRAVVPLLYDIALEELRNSALHAAANNNNTKHRHIDGNINVNTIHHRSMRDNAVWMIFQRMTTHFMRSIAHTSRAPSARPSAHPLAPLTPASCRRYSDRMLLWSGTDKKTENRASSSNSTPQFCILWRRDDHTKKNNTRLLLHLFITGLTPHIDFKVSAIAYDEKSIDGSGKHSVVEDVTDTAGVLPCMRESSLPLRKSS